MDGKTDEIPNKTEYKYFAFISYSRKDSRAASFFHRKIEHFRIPTKYVAPERLPRNRKFAKPVFRDRRDLETRQNSFSEDIKRALESSRYLLVICSPNSAGSEWVEAEISHFLKTHGNDLSLVVPVILTGLPGSGSSDSECLSPSLRNEAVLYRNLPSMIPDAGEQEKDGWENGVIQTLSYLLQVSRERIRASVDAERVRQTRIYAVIGVACAIMFGLLSFWALHAEKKAAENERRAIDREKEVERQRTEAVSNASLARHQKDISDSALEFMMGTFNRVDPTHSGRYDVMMSEALEGSVSEVGKLDPWELRAFVSARVGSLLDNIGSYESASNMLFSAYALNMARRPQSEETAYALYALSWWYAHQHDYVYARELSFKSLGIYEKCGKTNSLEIARVHNTIGMMSMYLGRKHYGEAEEHLLRAQVVREDVFGARSPKVAVGLKNLGHLYRAEKKPFKALQHFERALSILKDAEMIDDNTAQSLIGLALVYRDMADYEESIEKFEEALSIRLACSGENCRGTVNVLKEIGNTRRRNGQYGQAFEAYERALKASIKVLGENDAITQDLRLSMEQMKREEQREKASE